MCVCVCVCVCVNSYICLYASKHVCVGCLYIGLYIEFFTLR